jgi:hypothetical protein
LADFSTKKGKYVMCPIETLQFVPKGSVKAEPVPLPDTFDDDFKPGLYAQTKEFLENPASPDLLSLAEQIRNARDTCVCELPELCSRLLA